MLEFVSPVDHKYVVPGLDVKVTLPPLQKVFGPEAVMVGVAGKALTVTFTSEFTVLNPSNTATL